ncbi:hypothetical protein ColKHC_09304 [Colletotrichum higginsianum]|nr:hypothetical protein ColKHC_09304 [Colletotrichum higginsianum]
MCASKGTRSLTAAAGAPSGTTPLQANSAAMASTGKRPFLRATREVIGYDGGGVARRYSR